MNGFLQTFHNCHFLAIIPALRKIRKEPPRFAGPELTTIHCPGLVAMAMDALGAGAHLKAGFVQLVQPFEGR